MFEDWIAELARRRVDGLDRPAGLCSQREADRRVQRVVTQVEATSAEAVESAVRILRGVRRTTSSHGSLLLRSHHHHLVHDLGWRLVETSDDGWELRPP